MRFAIPCLVTDPDISWVSGACEGKEKVNRHQLRRVNMKCFVRTLPPGGIIYTAFLLPPTEIFDVGIGSKFD